MNFIRNLAWAALTLAAIHAQAQGTSDLLKAADRYRMSATHMQVDTQINTFNTDGSPDKERRYTVFAQANHQSLVLMQSPAEKGQKVLMLADDFWLLMPNSQRPLRITPMQKLLGDASTGDIATMSWADDYSATLVGDESCGSAPCVHLSLTAARKGVTYQRIELWIGKVKHEPIKADLYVQSDKLAKQARFVMDKPSAPTAVAEMVLQDRLSNHKETRVRYLARKERTVPEAWLNPMFLARNPSLDSHHALLLKPLATLLAAGAAMSAWADTDYSGQVRARWDDRQPATQGPLAQAAQLAPERVALPVSSGAIESELRGHWKMLSAAVALRQERPESAAWHSDAQVNELYASGDALGWQLSAGRKIVAWDVGYGFRPNDLVQQEQRRALLGSTPQGRAVVQAEHFDATTAWSLVWVNPQRAGDSAGSPAFGADEQALAARVYRHVGEADWHGFARYGQRTRASLGAALSWVASDSLEVHASGRWAERADVLAFDAAAAAAGLATGSPYRVVTQDKRPQVLVGAMWTAENKIGLMAEWWYDSTAAPNAQWDAWNARNRQLAQASFAGAPDGLRRGVAGNLGWQAQAFSAGQSLRRNNLFARVSWDHEGWQPSLDVLYMPADRGRVLTAALGWQGDRVRVDAGWRVNGGPGESVAAQLPVRRTVYLAATWSL